MHNSLIIFLLLQNEDYFSQLVDRRQSLNLEESPPTSTNRRHFGSVPDLKLISSPSLTEIPLTPGDSLSNKELSSDDEVCLYIL